MSNFVESSVEYRIFVMIMMEICLAFEMMLILLSVTRFEGAEKNYINREDAFLPVHFLLWLPFRMTIATV